MKKSVLFICLGLLSFAGKATHLMGGQMTSRNIGGLTYEITLTAYRDTQGVPMNPVTTFNYSDATGFSQMNQVNLNGPTVLGNGVEEYTYIDTITLPAGGNYSVWYEDCCRNCAIINIPQPCSYSFHLYNNFLADPSNSSPVFLNSPITIAQNNVAFSYNPLPFDADGDSLAWALDVPVTSGGAYVAGYTLPPSDPGVPFTMDAATGVVSFLPNTLGNFEVSVLVSEYRNGVQIGEIRRDMQIIVVNSLNAPVLVSSTSTAAPVGPNQFNVPPGSPFTLTVAVLDQDFQMITLSARGEPFMLSSNPATISSITALGVLNGTVSWTPNVLQERSAPYIFALRITEPFALYTFSTDLTYELRVTTATAIAPVVDKSVRGLFPNPNDGNFTLEFACLSSGKADIIISNLIGQQVNAIRDIQLNEGVNAVVVKNPTSLPKGHYTISVVMDGKISSVNNFEVTY